jgi:hypothetical protein
MLLSKMNSTTFSLGSFKRPDGEIFEISARLYECQPEYDYWLTVYDAAHKDRKQTHFSLFMPKKIAPSTHIAQTILKGEGLDQVKFSLLQAVRGSNYSKCLTVQISGT